MVKNYAFICAILLLFFANTPTVASQPPGLDKQNKTPPGFSQGKKKGWSGTNPPGWNQSSIEKNKKNKIKNNDIKKLEFDCDSLADGEYDERCTNLKKKGKKMIKPGHIKGNIDK